jgi:hypothetical protein
MIDGRGTTAWPSSLYSSRAKAAETKSMTTIATPTIQVFMAVVVLLLLLLVIAADEVVLLLYPVVCGHTRCGHSHGVRQQRAAVAQVSNALRQFLALTTII